ncbi:hypothetical protein WJX72_001930 [[Myrmecia] bisecta]|uniref:DUF7794 domain-containing protein n=1 Tax=[Myrmecia] bisecta TaxID=41462 RepID=A0AAW1R513_9CHLO
MLWIRALVWASALIWCAASQPTVLFVDSSDGGFLNSVVSLEQLSAEGLSAVVASLLAVQPPAAVSAVVSQQVEALIKPNIFARPEALLAIQIAGVDPAVVTKESAAALLGERPQHRVTFNAAAPHTALVTALRAVAEGTPSRLNYHALDFTGLSGCSDACVEQLLKETLAGLGGSYSPGPGPMTGIVNLPSSTSGPPVQLDLGSLAERLWATELATLHQTVADVIAEKVRREAQGEDSGPAAPELLEATLVGMQGVLEAHGADSAQYAAAWAALVAELRGAQDKLSKAFNNRLVSQISLLGEVPAGKDNMRSLLQWREAHRFRQLLAPVPGYTAGNETSPEQWATKAIAWTSFIILLFFTLAGICCLTNMQFKRDSLLYGRAKAD